MSQSAKAVANGAKVAADRANLRGRHKEPHGQNPPNDMKFIKADIVAPPSRTKASFIIRPTHRRLVWAPGSSPNVGILTLFWLRPFAAVQHSILRFQLRTGSLPILDAQDWPFAPCLLSDPQPAIAAVPPTAT